MNGWLLAAGVTAAGVAGVHLVAGHRDPVRPLLTSGLADVPKRTLHAVWHLVSADLALAAAVLIYLAVEPQSSGTDLVALFVAVHFIAYSAVFLVITVSAGWSKPLLRLPQWMLLLPVAIMSWLGTG
ncbi:hypothetical protein OTB20_34815 [Streptomyces sp. H27-H1]|uniref:hypothetical protein n=1 Tax=Streptomyces sp. H27-H1 TaxID=2996461 RepID=UPI0022700ACB|nr:hypothetical protein [Streptomyces sp. H27-H1]MCY0931268.1 hypothetical protein [Streptomyces sp. H27-H1]